MSKTLLTALRDIADGVSTIVKGQQFRANAEQTAEFLRTGEAEVSAEQPADEPEAPAPQSPVMGTDAAPQVMTEAPVKASDPVQARQGKGKA